MADFNNLDELKALKARGAVNEQQYELLKKRLARKIVSERRQTAYAKNGIIYIFLAFIFGAIGLHNFYAGYYKRGWTQAILTIVSPLFAFLPLLFTAGWAFLELLAVSKGANGVPFRGSKILLWGLRLMAVIVFIVVYKQAELVTES